MGTQRRTALVLLSIPPLIFAGGYAAAWFARDWTAAAGYIGFMAFAFVMASGVCLWHAVVLALEPRETRSGWFVALCLALPAGYLFFLWAWFFRPHWFG
jgi:hypothetical protein